VKKTGYDVERINSKNGKKRKGASDVISLSFEQMDDAMMTDSGRAIASLLQMSHTLATVVIPNLYDLNIMLPPSIGEALFPLIPILVKQYERECHRSSFWFREPCYHTLCTLADHHLHKCFRWACFHFQRSGQDAFIDALNVCCEARGAVWDELVTWIISVMEPPSKSAWIRPLHKRTLLDPLASFCYRGDLKKIKLLTTTVPVPIKRHHVVGSAGIWICVKILPFPVDIAEWFLVTFGVSGWGNFVGDDCHLEELCSYGHHDALRWMAAKLSMSHTRIRKALDSNYFSVCSGCRAALLACLDR
jgi:hypothetical protein